MAATARATFERSCVRPNASSTCADIDCTPRLDAVDTGRAVGAQHVDRDVVGVALDGDLGIGADRDRCDDRGEVSGRDQRGSAAAHEHGVGDREAGTDRSVDLPSQRPEVLVDQMVAVGPCGERAVLALGRAERDVYVHPELRSTHDPSQPAGGAGQALGTNSRSSAASRCATWSTGTSSIAAIERVSSPRTVMTRPLKS